MDKHLIRDLSLVLFGVLQFLPPRAGLVQQLVGNGPEARWRLLNLAMGLVVIVVFGAISLFSARMSQQR